MSLDNKLTSMIDREHYEKLESPCIDYHYQSYVKDMGFCMSRQEYIRSIYIPCGYAERFKRSYVKVYLENESMREKYLKGEIR